jgi:hypothetical protein
MRAKTRQVACDGHLQSMKSHSSCTQPMETGRRVQLQGTAAFELHLTDIPCVLPSAAGSDNHVECSTHAK